MPYYPRAWRIWTVALPVLAMAPWLVSAHRQVQNAPQEGLGSQAAPTHVGAVHIDVTQRPLSRIKPGAAIDDGPPEGWSHLVLLARPRVARGDVNQVAPEVLRFGSMFMVAIAANVRANPGAAGEKHQLDKVGVGLAMELEGRVVVVSSATQQAQGAELDYIGRQVLAGTEQCLDEVIQAARTPQMLVFDAWSIVLRDEAHRRMAVRHAVLVDAETGELATLVWLLESGGSGEFALVDPEMQVLPRNLQEDRVLNVRADNLVLGLLTGKRDGFALVDIPQGRPIKLPGELLPLACSRFRTPAEATALEAALRKLIAK
ncbi:MAG: hypothetical protein HY000_23770 [Planctomycetes bacterium]|nr:hypothetical protein [Planctomycetota bacterium]